MKVWIITDIHEESYVAQTAIAAYNFCRKCIQNDAADDEEAEWFLNELAHSYSNSRASFGVENIIWARSTDIILD